MADANREIDALVRAITQSLEDAPDEWVVRGAKPSTVMAHPMGAVFHNGAPIALAHDRSSVALSLGQWPESVVIEVHGVPMPDDAAHGEALRNVVVELLARRASITLIDVPKPAPTESVVRARAIVSWNLSADENPNVGPLVIRRSTDVPRIDASNVKLPPSPPADPAPDADEETPEEPR